MEEIKSATGLSWPGRVFVLAMLAVFGWLILVGAPAKASVADINAGSLIPKSSDVFKGSPFLATNFADVPSTIGTIFRVIIAASAAIFLIILIIGGITYLSSSGNEEGTGKAKKMMLDAVIGLAIVLAVWGIGTWVLKQVGFDLKSTATTGTTTGTSDSSFESLIEKNVPGLLVGQYDNGMSTKILLNGTTITPSQFESTYCANSVKSSNSTQLPDEVAKALGWGSSSSALKGYSCSPNASDALIQNQNSKPVLPSAIWFTNAPNKNMANISTPIPITTQTPTDESSIVGRIIGLYEQNIGAILKSDSANLGEFKSLCKDTATSSQLPSDAARIIGWGSTLQGYRCSPKPNDYLVESSKDGLAVAPSTIWFTTATNQLAVSSSSGAENSNVITHDRDTGFIVKEYGSIPSNKFIIAIIPSTSLDDYVVQGLGNNPYSSFKSACYSTTIKSANLPPLAWTAILVKNAGLNDLGYNSAQVPAWFSASCVPQSSELNTSTNRTLMRVWFFQNGASTTGGKKGFIGTIQGWISSAINSIYGIFK